MRVALVHDWLTGMRGGEKVLEQLCLLFPEAPIYTLFHFQGSVSPIIESHHIVASFLQKAPFARARYRNYLPFFPRAIESFHMEEYDLVLSSSHCVAKGILAGGTHICYCHTPMRYIWSHYEDYFGSERVGLLEGGIIRLVAHRLRKWDRSTCSRVHRFVANSKFVAERIRKYYAREASVVYPPVDVDFFSPSDAPRQDFFLVVSALVPYKRLEIAIEAFRTLKSSLVIVGLGPEKQRLVKAAAGAENIRFVGRVGQEELRNLYRTAKGLIQPAIEDFGINMVEAQACGCPVIAFAAGGALESVLDGETGVFFDRLDADSLRAAIDRSTRLRFNSASMRKSVLCFAPSHFREEMNAVIQTSYARADNG
jgi:glycosyltransferase involved in cell wall biosynthesis